MGDLRHVIKHAGVALQAGEVALAAKLLDVLRKRVYKLHLERHGRGGVGEMDRPIDGWGVRVD